MPTIRQILVLCGWKLVSVCVMVVALFSLLIMRLIKGQDFFKVKPRPTPPAILNDPKWGNHKYANLKSQGIRLHYVEAGDHQKPLIICLHGIFDCWFAWRHQLQHFSQNYWVVAVDLRGCGDSDKPSRTSDYSFTLVLEDIRQFVLALGKDKCTLLSHDWGGAFAWQLVIRHPEMFNYHIGCNTLHPTVVSKLFRSWKQMLNHWYLILFQAPWVPELIFSSDDLKAFETMYRGKENNIEACPDEVIEAFKYYFSQKDALTPPFNYFRNIGSIQFESKFSKVTVPTLIIWGVNEPQYSKDHATQSGNECESAEVKFVEGAGHWVHQEKPKEVNTYIQEFLSAKH